MQLLALALLGAAPWTAEVHPALDEGWEVEHSAVVDDAWAGFIAKGDHGPAVFVMRPPEAPQQVLAIANTQPLKGLGLSVLTQSDTGYIAWRIEGDPKPTARRAAALERPPRAFHCARDVDVCAWVDESTLVIARGDLRTELTWEPDRHFMRDRIRPTGDVPDIKRSVALEDIENLGVSPDGERLALQFHTLVLVLTADGQRAALAAADVTFHGDTVPAVRSALEERIARSKAWWNKRDSCRVVIDGWKAPHALELFIDQSTDPGDPECGVETGPAEMEGSSEFGAPQWTWQVRGCGWRHPSGATLTRACPQDIGDQLAEPLALSPDALMFEEEWAEYWYVPPSRQRPFTRVHLEAKDETPPAWHVVTFGGAVPGVQRLPKPEDVGTLQLSLTSGWHLFESNQDRRMRWVRFERGARRQVAAK